MADKKVNSHHFDDIETSIGDMLNKPCLNPAQQTQSDDQVGSNQGETAELDTVFSAIASDKHIQFDTSAAPSDSNELVDVMIHHLMHSEREKNFAYIEKISKIISHDVTEQLQQHISSLLPTLIKASLKQHLQGQTSILNNKDFKDIDKEQEKT